MEKSKIVLYFSIICEGDWDKIYQAIMNPTVIPDENEIYRVIKNVKSNYVTFFDEDYPTFLKSVCKPPFVLYYHGNIKLLDCYFKSVCVVGSRHYSEYGERVTRKLVSELSKELVIISGLASGIDSIAHEAAIASGGKTIAVLGSGINYVYPYENKKLYERIKKDHLVISEYPDLTPPSTKTFPIRNRIVSGLTHCCLIPEGKINSGTQITASLMASRGGAVCCVPGEIGNNSLCNLLIKEGACLVETSQDVFDEMRYARGESTFK